MLEVLIDQKQALYKRETPKEIIITKYNKKITYNEKNQRIEEKIPVLVNITKKVNETKKLIKIEKAKELLNEIEKIYTENKQ